MTNRTKPGQPSHREMNIAARIVVSGSRRKDLPQRLIDLANNIPIPLDPTKPHVEINVSRTTLILTGKAPDGYVLERRIKFKSVKAMKNALVTEAEAFQEFLQVLRTSVTTLEPDTEET